VEEHLLSQGMLRELRKNVVLLEVEIAALESSR